MYFFVKLTWLLNSIPIIKYPSLPKTNHEMVHHHPRTAAKTALSPPRWLNAVRTKEAKHIK